MVISVQIMSPVAEAKSMHARIRMQKKRAVCVKRQQYQETAHHKTAGHIQSMVTPVLIMRLEELVKSMLVRIRSPEQLAALHVEQQVEKQSRVLPKKGGPIPSMGIHVQTMRLEGRAKNMHARIRKRRRHAVRVEEEELEEEELALHRALGRTLSMAISAMIICQGARHSNIGARMTKR